MPPSLMLLIDLNGGLGGKNPTHDWAITAVSILTRITAKVGSPYQCFREAKGG